MPYSQLIYTRKNTHFWLRRGNEKKTISTLHERSAKNNYNIISLHNAYFALSSLSIASHHSMLRFFLCFACFWQRMDDFVCNRVCFVFFLHSLSTFVCLLVFFLFVFSLFSRVTGRIQVSYSRFGGLLFSFLFFFYFLCCLLRLFLAFSSGSRAQTR